MTIIPHVERGLLVLLVSDYYFSPLQIAALHFCKSQISPLCFNAYNNTIFSHFGL